MAFNTGPYTVLPDNSVLNTANMQSETGFPSSHQLKSYVASKSRLKLAARAVLSADAGLVVNKCVKKFHANLTSFFIVRQHSTAMHSMILLQHLSVIRWYCVRMTEQTAAQLTLHASIGILVF